MRDEMPELFEADLRALVQHGPDQLDENHDGTQQESSDDLERSREAAPRKLVPMFLTPEGIKTLFPIFENSCWKHELAEKTLEYF